MRVTGRANRVRFRIFVCRDSVADRRDADYVLSRARNRYFAFFSSFGKKKKTTPRELRHGNAKLYNHIDNRYLANKIFAGYREFISTALVLMFNAAAICEIPYKRDIYGIQIYYKCRTERPQ